MTLCENKQNIKYWQNPAFIPVYDSSLVLWLTSDFGTSTQWLDKSSYGVITTPTNAIRAPIHPSGIFGSTFLFNGVNQSIECGNLPQYTITTNGVSLEAWINIVAADKFYPIITKRIGTSTPNYALNCNRFNKLELGYCHGINNFDGITSMGNYIDGKWHHVIGTIDFTTGIKNLYVDGIPDSTGSSISTGDAICTSSNPLTIGRDGTQYFNGYADSIRIYNRPLSQTEVSYNHIHSQLYYIINTIN